jgi:hypothetical protein
MLVNQNEANEYRCCGPEGTGQDKRTKDLTPIFLGRFCIGTKCMAWRKVSGNETLGFCGLAYGRVRMTHSQGNTNRDFRHG